MRHSDEYGVSMGIFQPSHILILVIILAIALVIFGPGKLGDVGGALGKSVKEFRTSSKNEDDKGPDANSTAPSSSTTPTS
jgi:sec-independent protein translocase protein TatA